MFHILVVEDDAKTAFPVLHGTHQQWLSGAWQKAAKRLSLLDSEYVDLIISDIMMSGMDGYELIDHLRTSGFTMPILIITAKERFEDKQRGFQAGTDDYMVKPIDVNEMVLRVGALLKRAKIATGASDCSPKYDPRLRRTDGHGQRTGDVSAAAVLYLLHKLLSYPNKIFTRQQLMDEIWGLDRGTTDERTVDVHVNRLRERFKLR